MARSLEVSFMGVPKVFPDLAARRARMASEASDWKKWPGSVERDILISGAKKYVYVRVCKVVLL